MNLSDIRFIFNRAIAHTFSTKKLLSIFCVLLLCGILVVFFRGLALHAGQWISMSLTFLPIFLCAGVLLSAGIVLERAYHDEIKQKKKVSYRAIIANSWEIIIAASYFTMPLILGYLLLWMLLGIFFLLKGIPLIGEFFGVVLAFAPFVLNLGMLLLCFLSIALLFFVTPAMALKGVNGIQALQMVLKRIQQDVFSNLLLISLAVLPLVVLAGVLALTAMLTGALCYFCDNPVHIILQWFFMMIPFVAVLAPAVIFFFNFSAESHVLLLKKENSTT